MRSIVSIKHFTVYSNDGITLRKGTTVEHYLRLILSMFRLNGDMLAYVQLYCLKDTICTYMGDPPDLI